jgi:hypothetical protein
MTGKKLNRSVRRVPERKEKARLSSLLDFAGTDASRTNAQPASSAIHQGANRLQIYIPSPLRNVMGVTDPIAELRAFSTHCANLCHTEIS